VRLADLELHFASAIADSCVNNRRKTLEAIQSHMLAQVGQVPRQWLKRDDSPTGTDQFGEDEGVEADVRPDVVSPFLFSASRS